MSDSRVSTPRIYLALILTILCSSVLAQVSADGQRLSWPDGDWFQVQDASTMETICEGTQYCDVSAGTYIVINHSSGQRWEDVVVGDELPTNTDPATPDPVSGTPTVVGNTISWTGDGWHQVQNQNSFVSICNGGSSCDVEPGSYVVINHSSGQRWENIVVESVASPLADSSSITLDGSTLSWSLSGWVQVQDAETYLNVCEGGSSCELEAGTYVLIDHSDGRRYEGIQVVDSLADETDTTAPVESPIDLPIASAPSVNGNEISFGEDGWYEVQRTEDFSAVCEGTGSCFVESGSYIVINHSSGDRWEGITVLPYGSDGTEPENERNPPMFQPVPDQQLLASWDYLYLEIRASSDTGYPLLTPEILPDGMSTEIYEEGTLNLAWAPELGDEGEYTIALLATDPVNPALTSRLEFRVTVLPAPNMPPHLTSPSLGRSHVVEIGESWNIDFEAFDDYSEELEFTLTASPEGINLLPTSGTTATLSWTPEHSDEGYHRVVVSVHDPEYSSDIPLDVQVVAACESTTSGSILGVDCLPGNFGQHVADRVANHISSGPMRGIGDINGDGYDDVALVSPIVEYFSYEPFVLNRYGYVLFGSQEGLPSEITPGLTSIELGFNLLGPRVSNRPDIRGIGDIDKDGFDDFAVMGEGDTVSIVYGRTQFPRELNLTTIAPGSSLRIVGMDTSSSRTPKVGYAGDFNGDDIDDFYVSTVDRGTSTVDPERIIFGSTNRKTGDLLFSSLALPDAMQIKVRDRSPFDPDEVEEVESVLDYTGDFDSDGYADLIVTQSGSDGTFILYGTANPEELLILESGLSDSRYTPIVLKERSSFRADFISGGGDFNGDGSADIAFVTNGIPDVFVHAAFLLLGSSDRTDKITLTETNSSRLIQIGPGASIFLRHGDSIVFIDDFNADGLDDLAVGNALGSPQNSGGTDNSVYIIVGDDGPLSQYENSLETFSYTWVRGTFDGSRVGDDVQAGGDINGDGYSDLLIPVDLREFLVNRPASETAVIFGR